MFDTIYLYIRAKILLVQFSNFPSHFALMKKKNENRHLRIVRTFVDFT